MSKARDLASTRNLTIRTSWFNDGVIVGYSEGFSTITTSGGVLTVSLAHNFYVVNVTENITSIVFTNWQSAGNLGPVTLLFKQVGGPWTCSAFDVGGYLWAEGVVTPLTAAADAKDFYTFFSYDNGTTIFVQPVGPNMLSVP